MLVTLISSSGTGFKINKEFLLAQSGETAANLLEGAETEDDHTIIIPNAPDDVLSIIVNYINLHKTTKEPPMKYPLRSKLIERNVSDQDMEIVSQINQHRNIIQSILNTTDFIHIQGLIDLCTKMCACAIMCTPVEKLDELFKDEEKPTPEQLRQFDKLVRAPTGILFE